MKKSTFNYILENYKSKIDPWVEYTKKQKTLSDAIRIAILSLNKKGKMHPHQYRIGMEKLKDYAKHLNINKNISEIKKTKSFENLLHVIEKLSKSRDGKGIGELASYDISNRIGAYLGHKPKKIYLHSGTRVGAEKLLGKKIKGNSIAKSELPEPFKNSNLSCEYLEDILCIFKDDFDKNISEIKGNSCFHNEYRHCK